MGNVRDDGWEASTLYSEPQVEAVLEECGLSIDSDSDSNFFLYCPFHGNRDTPSFTVSKSEGLYHCFNPSCGESGTLLELVMRLTKLNPFAAMRLVGRHKSAEAISFEDRIRAELEGKPEWPVFDAEVLSRCYDDFWQVERPQEYMHGRGFVDETLRHFRIGYSQKRDSIMVPMHSPDGVPIGVIGRSIEGKDFKNSKGLPKNKTAWNFHRAKREGDSVIVCEASFDAMRIHQAGYRNVVALLGGNFSDLQQHQLARSFNTIILMTDYDDRTRHINKNCVKCKKSGSNLCRGHNPGEELGAKIAMKMRTKRILWAHHGGSTRFPPGVKDAGDMTDSQIRFCISNAVSNVEYALEI